MTADPTMTLLTVGVAIAAFFVGWYAAKYREARRREYDPLDAMTKKQLKEIRRRMKDPV